MNRTVTVKRVAACWMAAFMSGAWAAEPAISNVNVHQRWPWSRLVDIDYALTCDDSNRVDIAIAAYNGSEALTLPMSSLSGDIYGMSQQGMHHFVWDPAKSVYTNELLTLFHMRLTPTNSPTYMIVDLTKNAGDQNQITYLFCGTNVWYDVTNDTQYMTSKLVLRRIAAGAFTNASSQKATLTKDAYVGVFEVTQAQWTNVMGSSTWPSCNFTNSDCRATRPVEHVAYVTLRGTSAGTNWPGSGAVDDSSFIGKLRSKTAMPFDLPTETQWEYACRAGTTTVFNDGDPTANTSGTTNRWLDKLGRYQYNGGQLCTNGVWFYPPFNCGDTNATAKVGSYQPNRWGLYDMHGNVHELCLDWYSGSMTGGADPVGPSSNSGTNRIIRGGAWFNPASQCTSAFRFPHGQTTSHDQVGLRVCISLP